MGRARHECRRAIICRTLLPYRSGPLDVATGLPTRLGEQEAAARLGLPPKRWGAGGGSVEGLAGAAEAVGMTAGVGGQEGVLEDRTG